MPEVQKVVPGSAGAFLDPPGHPHHKFHVETYRSARSKEPDSVVFLSTARDNPEEYPQVQARVAKLFADAEMVCSETWMRYVYNYFRSMYAPENGDRNVSNAISDPTNSLPPERHLGYLTVKEHFPDHTPRLDLIRLPAGHGYGQMPCIKCGERVQYEAKFDGFEISGKGPECSRGGVHEIAGE